jgi:hypothetical protein
MLAGKFARGRLLVRSASWINGIVLAAAFLLAPRTGASEDARASLAERVTALTRDTRWALVDRVPVSFKTFHPQGMVKIGDNFFVSSVEVRVAPKRFASPADGYDRDPGEGVGHLFKFDRTGRLITDLELGEGTIYHPGGIDYDGTHIWVPVAEYRPNGRAILYRVTPDAMVATRVAAIDDHIGALVHDLATKTLHGYSWGSRRLYRWTLDDKGGVTGEATRRLNPSHYVDYQDCKSAGAGRMLCTGVAEIRSTPDAAPFRLGGIELIDVNDGRPIHQVPVLLWTPGGRVMTQNPAWFEPTATGMRGYFMPEDDSSTIYIYDASTPASPGTHVESPAAASKARRDASRP